MSLRNIDIKKLKAFQTVLSKIQIWAMFITVIIIVISFFIPHIWINLTLYTCAALLGISLACTVAEPFVSSMVLRIENKQTILALSANKARKIKFKKVNNVFLKELLKFSEVEAEYNKENDTISFIFTLLADNGKISKRITVKKEDIVSKIEVI